MQITVPSTVSNHPQIITIGGVSYALSAGETVDVPEEIAIELSRMLESAEHDAPPVAPPFENADVDAALDDLNTRVSAAEVKELPAFPETAGTYKLQLVVADGEATLTWEAVES